MPLIPACSIAAAQLAIAYLEGKGTISPSAQATFEKTLPPPFRFTRKRYEAKVNVIKEYMGQGGDAQGAMQNTDEAVMLAKAKL
jgi:hypothetical protein